MLAPVCRSRPALCTCLLYLFLALVARHAEGAEEGGNPAGGEHEASLPVSIDRASGAIDRLDITGAAITQDSGDQGGLFIQYTRSFGKHQLALATPFFDTELGGDILLSAGDLVVDYAWSPRVTISASPWVPADFGTGIRLSVPTGSVAKGTGTGSVILIPRLGTVFEAGSAWAIAPSIEYQYAFAYEDDAELVRGIGLESQFIYISTSAFWFNFTPSYTHDSNSGQGAPGGSVTLGKLLTMHFALSLRYTREPVYGERQFEAGFDYADVWQLGFHIPLRYAK